MIGPACSSLQGGSNGTKAATANNHFCLDLYQRTKATPENLFFSPVSISSALAMTYAGARGQTEKEMAQTLHFDLPQSQVHPAFAALNQRIEQIGKSNKVSLSVANSIWCQQGSDFNSSFINLVRDSYQAEARLVDFVGRSEPTRIEINDWVAKKTQDKIKDLLQPGQLTADTRLVLCNAIYFKGKWLEPFDEKATRPQKFNLSNDRQIDTPTMHKKITLASLDTGDAVVFSLPYVGEELSLVVLLPKSIDGLPQLEKRLNLATWLAQLDAVRKQEVDLYLPRFKINCRLELAQTLADMGMRHAFSRGADFSGISQQEQLFISDVVHQAFVEVNEEGTEAAAATGVVMRGTSVMRTPMIRVDRPFLFLIREHQTGSILFLGKVVDPSN